MVSLIKKSHNLSIFKTEPHDCLQRLGKLTSLAAQHINISCLTPMHITDLLNLHQLHLFVYLNAMYSEIQLKLKLSQLELEPSTNKRASTAMIKMYTLPHNWEPCQANHAQHKSTAQRRWYTADRKRRLYTLPTTIIYYSTTLNPKNPKKQMKSGWTGQIGRWLMTAKTTEL